MKSRLGLAALFAMAFAAGAAAQTRQNSTVLMSEDKGSRQFQDEWGYSDAIVAGDTIYLSGVVVRPEGDPDLEAAYDRTYQRIGAILERAGASWDDVVDITSYHTDVVSQMKVMVAVQRRYIRAPFPAWTAIDVDRLIPDRGITEIKIVAIRPPRKARSRPRRGR